ncbi:MAG: ABC transporter permease [Gemmatimonadota bacterium]|jgi:predicted permease
MTYLGRAAREAWRALAQYPRLLFLVSLPTAVGIATVASVLAVANDTVLSNLPFPAPEELVDIRGQSNRDPGVPRSLSYPDFQDLEEAARGTLTMGAYSGSRPFNLEHGGEGVAVTGEFVSSGFFDALSIQPYRGRYFRSQEDISGSGSGTVVVSEALWQNRLGGSLAFPGSTIRIGGVPFEVVGIAPPGFQGLNDGADLWMTVPAAGLIWGPEFVNRRSLRWLMSVGRLGTDTNMNVARQVMSRAGGDLEETYPEINKDLGVMIRPLPGKYLPDFRASLAALGAGAVMLLVLVTANVASVLLIDALRRSEDIALRTALGATSADHLAQITGRVLALTGPGGLVGLTVGMSAAGPLLRLSQVEVPAVWGSTARLGSILGLVGVVVLVGVAAGLAPAVLLRRQATANRRRAGIPVAAARGFRWLAALQVALALALTCGTLTLVRSFRGLMDTELGFSPEGIATLRVATSDRAFRNQEEFRAFLNELHSTVATTPGVEAASLTGPSLPLEPMNGAMVFSQEKLEDGADTPTLIRLIYVTPGTLDLLGLSLEQGRHFDRRDQAADAQRTMVVSRDLAERFWPGRDAVGQRMALASGLDSWNVVGVSSRALMEGSLSESSRDPFGYFPISQAPSGLLPVVNILARPSSGKASGLLEPIRRRIEKRFPSMELFDLATLSDRFHGQMGGARFLVSLLAAFSILSASVAVLGTFGAFSQLMALHRREFALRLALGSTPNLIRRLAVHRGIWPGLAGLMLGSLLAVALSPTVPAMAAWAATLQGRDLLTATALLGFGISLGILPAFRGIAADPMAILQSE